MEGAWTVSEGRAFRSFTVRGKKENCLFGLCGRRSVGKSCSVLVSREKSQPFTSLVLHTWPWLPTKPSPDMSPPLKLYPDKLVS